MSINFQKLFQSIIGTEEIIVPLFIHNPASQSIAAVVLTTEQAVASIFGLGTTTQPVANAKTATTK